MANNDGVTIVDAAVDWITATYHANGDRAREFEALGLDFVRETSLQGAKVGEMKPQGFYGVGSEHAFIGRRENWLMLRGSGKAAHVLTGKIVEADFEPKITRIDCQVTAEYEEEKAGYSYRLRDSLASAEATVRAGKRRPKAVYEDCNRDTGITAGSRSSASYARIYHPSSAGHSDYSDRCWRFEVEFKQERASGIFDLLRRSENPAITASSLVKAHLSSIGINEPWFTHTDVAAIPPNYKSKTDQKRWEWLLTTACPVIRKLLDNEEYREKTLQLLRDMRLGKMES